MHPNFWLYVQPPTFQEFNYITPMSVAWIGTMSMKAHLQPQHFLERIPPLGRRHGFLSRGVESSANLPQNTLKIGKTPDFGHFILESGGSNRPVFKSGSGPPDAPVGDAPAATPGPVRSAHMGGARRMAGVAVATPTSPIVSCHTNISQFYHGVRSTGVDTCRFRYSKTATTLFNDAIPYR